MSLLNPFGGQGLAPRKWEVAKQLFDLSHLDVTLRPTERAMHAHEITKSELQPGEYDCVITISGDGLIHEVVNGAFSREDRDEFLEKTTFGFVPAGTANGLVQTILDQHDEVFGILNAAFLIAKGSRIKMDLTEITLEYQPETKLYMFLMMAWALVSDCDINSEVIRCIGSPRFTIWGVYRLMALRNYYGKFSVQGQKILSNKFEEIKTTEEQIDYDVNFKHLCIFNTPWIGKGMKMAPMTTLKDGTNDITLLTSDKSRLQFAKLLILQDDGDYFNGPSSRNPGALSASMGLDYLKTSSWDLKPLRKGTLPEGSTY